MMKWTLFGGLLAVLGVSMGWNYYLRYLGSTTETAFDMIKNKQDMECHVLLDAKQGNPHVFVPDHCDTSKKGAE